MSNGKEGLSLNKRKEAKEEKLRIDKRRKEIEAEDDHNEDKGC